jgi:poly(A) polymerase
MRLSIFGVQIDLLLSRIKESFLRENPNFFEPGGLDTNINVPINER